MRAVLERDFLSTASRKRAFLLRSLVAAGVAATAWIVLLENGHLMSDRPDEAARWIFAGGAGALLALLFLLTPPSVVGSVLEERERQTLPLVLAAPVRPAALAAAKLLSRSMAVLTWALASIVPLVTVTLLGGVGTGQVADLAMLSVGLVVELGAWGVWISSVTGRLATGAILAYLLPVVRWALTLALFGMIAVPGAPWEDRLLDPGDRGALWVIASTTPATGIGSMVDPGQYERALMESLYECHSRGGVVYRYVNGVFVSSSPPGVSPPPPKASPHLLQPAAIYLASSLLGALVAVVLAGRRLALEAEPRRGLFAAVLERKRARRRPPDGGNPVAWKEQRLLNTAASRPLYYSVIALLVGGEVFFLVACGTVLRHEREMMEMSLFLASAHSTLVGLVAVVAGAAAIAHERSVGALDLLRASPLTPTDIMRGKMLGLLRGLGLLILIPLAHLGIAVAVGFMDPVSALAAVLLDGTFLLFFSMVGMLAGLSAFRMGAAVTRGAMAYGVFLVGIPLVATLIAVGFGQKRLGEALVFGCPPATTYLTLEGSLRALHPAWNLAHWYGRPLPLHRDHVIAMFWSAGYGAAALAAWFASPRLLARRFERERETG